MATLWGICSVLFVVINITSAQNECKTPDNWDGKCIALAQCRPLYALLRKKEIPTEQQTFLRSSQCGHDGTNVLICCANTLTVDDLPSGNACETGAAGDKIIGGERAGLSEFPWLALLHYEKPGIRGGFGCGGSLIHANYVLTAAHCVRGPTIIRKRHTLDYVRLGENDLRSEIDCQEDECADPIQDIPVAERIVHENYDPWSRTQANDIALIRLAHPATITKNSRPVCLPIQDFQNKTVDGSVLSVAGFGKTESASRSEVKMKLVLNVVNLEQCSNAYQRIGMNIANNVLCAGGEEGKDSCNGDSGGPLVTTTANDVSSYLVGVVSLGPAFCGRPAIPGVYTRVDKYVEWILDHMKK